MAKVAKKVALAMATTALGAALVGGASFALFTSSTTNSGNTFTAGTVVIGDNTAQGAVFSSAQYVANLAPGDSEQGTITVQNNGTLDEWVKIDDAATQQSVAGALFTTDANHMTITDDASVVKLAPGASHTFTVTYALPLAAGNNYQGATGSFNVVVDAVQARNNTNGAGTAPSSWS